MKYCSAMSILLVIGIKLEKSSLILWDHPNLERKFLGEKNMDIELVNRFTILWGKYFDGADLPITFYYTDKEEKDRLVEKPEKAHQCIIGVLNRVRKGEALAFGADSFGCSGGKRYLGFAKEVLMPNFEYFLSCGIEGELEGERYKKTPELVRQIVEKSPEFAAPGKYIVFKRWDELDAEDDPEVVVFFSPPDVLAGLFTLTGFDEVDRDAVIAPFAAGCGSIVLYPYLEIERDRPRGVLGMFDVSARPYVPRDTLSFAVPMKKITDMVADMEESFLITPSWEKVKKRIETKKGYEDAYVTT